MTDNMKVKVKMMHWLEIIPSNRFIAYMKHRIHETDRDVLTMLYQPLIGATAHSLYMTFTSLVSRSPHKNIEESHKSLMIYTGCKLDEIFEERKKLEAMNLLNVYRKKEGDEFVYYYELLPPLSPEQFFQDDLLSIFLYNRIGSKGQYLSLLNSFKMTKINDQEIEKVTRSFDEVFTSVLPSELKSDILHVTDSMNGQIALEGRKAQEDSIRIKGEGFDYDSFLAFLPAFISKEELQNEENKAAILKVAFLYKMEPSTMAKVVQDAILHTDQLDLPELRKQAKRRYRMNESDSPPSLGLRIQPEDLRVINKEKAPLTDEEKQIHYFETISPIEYLEEMNGGKKAFPRDIEIVEELMLEYGLEPGVVNVLLEYIFKIYNQKLTKNLASAIASQWSRAKIKTVKEAMNIANKEYSARNKAKEKNAEKGGAPNYYSRQKKVKQEPLPKWMTDESWNKDEGSEEEFLEANKQIEKYMEMLNKKD